MGSPKKGCEGYRKYGRDYLLQLRMHPLSLEKPKNLPAMEIIKDRLYFHQIDDIAPVCADETQSHYYTDAFVKHDNAFKIFNSRSSPGNISRNCTDSTSCQKYSSSPSSSFKYRSNYDTSYSSLQKQLYRSSYKSNISTEDFLENLTDFQTTPWFKETFPVYTNECEWNLSHDNSENKPQSSSNGCNPKSKKKLSIIDPKTGKNILEGIEESTASQSSVSSKENGEDEPKPKSSDAAINQENRTCLNDYGDMNLSIASDEDYSFLASTSKPSSEGATTSHNPDSSDDEFLREYSDFKRRNEHVGKRVQFEENDKITTSKIYDFSTSDNKGKKIPSSSKEEENTREDDLRADVRTSQQSGQVMKNKFSKISISGNEMTETATQSRQETDLKEKIILLRDKIYSMKQDQQKMAILQSFLRFKKQQLDESFRNLDDKKIDIVNWEYNLYNKAKKLHEKEYWLEVKLRNLKKKEKYLEEKEKSLELKEAEIQSKYNSVLKKDGINSYEVPAMNGEIDANKIVAIDAVDGKGDQEDNPKTHSIKMDGETIPLKHKDYSSGDVCDSQTMKQVKFKASDLGMITKQEKKVISEGRKYFPEQMKYWINKPSDKKPENAAKKDK